MFVLVERVEVGEGVYTIGSWDSRQALLAPLRVDCGLPSVPLLPSVTFEWTEGNL